VISEARLTEKVKLFASSLNVSLVGIASVERLMEAPEGYRPTDYLPDARSVISIGIPLNEYVVRMLPKSRREYVLNYNVVNAKLDAAAYSIASFVEAELGYAAIPFPASSPYDTDKQAGDISHKHVAVAAGLGRFGLSNLVITERYGPRVRFTSIVTNAPLESDPLIEGDLCDQCKTCIEACPSGALKDPVYDPLRGRSIDKLSCYSYMAKTLKGLQCGICVKACLDHMLAKRSK